MFLEGHISVYGLAEGHVNGPGALTASLDGSDHPLAETNRSKYLLGYSAAEMKINAW